MRTLFVVLFVACFVVNCGPTVSSTAFKSREPVPADHPVQVFMTKTPSCEYEELGVVTVSQGAFAGDSETYMPAMKEKARQMGGDAIISVTAGRETSGAVAVAPNVAAVGSSDTLTGTVIAFTEGCKEER